MQVSRGWWCLPQLRRPPQPPKRAFGWEKLTPAGRQALRSWLAAWGSPSFPSQATKTSVLKCCICRKSDYESQCKLQ